MSCAKLDSDAWFLWFAKEDGVGLLLTLQPVMDKGDSFLLHRARIDFVSSLRIFLSQVMATSQVLHFKFDHDSYLQDHARSSLMHPHGWKLIFGSFSAHFRTNSVQWMAQDACNIIFFAMRPRASSQRHVHGHVWPTWFESDD